METGREAPAPRHDGRHEHVADAARRELERRAEVLDLDDRLDRDAGLLGARGELEARRIVGRVAGVGQDQRPPRELPRADRPPHAMRLRADVEHLVAQGGLHHEPFGLDRQHDQPGLEPARAHVVGDGRGVEADDAQLSRRGSGR